MVGGRVGRRLDEGHRLTSERRMSSWWSGRSKAQEGSEDAGTEAEVLEGE